MNCIFLHAVFITSISAALLSIAVLATRKDEKGKNYLLLSIISCLFWTILEYLLMQDLPVESKIGITKLQYIFICSAPVLYSIYILRHNNLIGSSIKWLAFLLVVPILTILLAWTNPNHHLIWERMEEQRFLCGKALLITHGPMFFVYALYSYILIAVTSLLSLIRAHRYHGIFRIQSILLGTAALIPLAANALYIFNILDFKPLDITPVAFTLTNILLTLGFLRFRLQEVEPIARDTIFQGITDGLLVADHQGLPVYLNRRMKAILDWKEPVSLTKGREQLFEIFPELNRNGPFGGLTVTDRHYHLYYDVSKTPLKDRRGMIVGELYLFRDITQRKVLEDELRTLAQVDPLTKLNNRRYFMERAEIEIDRVRRYGGTLFLVMIDLDRFKGINDSYGHQSGDYVLQTFGNISNEMIRSTDLAGRIGGEEFAFILTSSNSGETTVFAERLRKAMENEEFLFQNKKETITLSGGISSLNSKSDSLKDLMKRTDRLLYQAKELGRNRICSEEMDNNP